MWTPSMTPGRIFIDVWNCRAVVARYTMTSDGLGWSPASNAEELEDQAAVAVSEQGGGVNLSGHYTCPDELAAQAAWEE